MSLLPSYNATQFVSTQVVIGSELGQLEQTPQTVAQAVATEQHDRRLFNAAVISVIFWNRTQRFSAHHRKNTPFLRESIPTRNPWRRQPDMSSATFGCYHTPIDVIFCTFFFDLHLFQFRSPCPTCRGDPRSTSHQKRPYLELQHTHTR